MLVNTNRKLKVLQLKNLRSMRIAIVIISLALASCATNSKSRWAAMGIAAPIGASMGALSAPPRERAELHALAWGSAFVALASVIGEYHFGDDEELEKLRKKVKDFENTFQPKLLNEGSGYLNHPSLDNTKPFKWKIYKIDKWVGDETIKYHQDLMLKVEPTEKLEKKNEEKSD